MVSRSCLSCLRQRRKCDRERPECRRCRAASRRCEGYADDGPLVFVNHDKQNISAPNKKTLLCNAIAETKKSHANQTIIELPGITASPHFNAGHFCQHVETLWQAFVNDYCRTADYWPFGCAVLAFQSEALDLAMIALSCQHLWFKSHDVTQRLIALTAYHKSLKLLPKLIEARSVSTQRSILSFTSLMFAMFEASEQPMENIFSIGYGVSGHLDGCLAQLRRCDPQDFGTGGLHIVFKKIRELTVNVALFNERGILLSATSWMTQPWLLHQKTWRDLLYDISMRLASLISQDRHSFCHLSALRKISESIDNWRRCWLRAQGLSDPADFSNPITLPESINNTDNKLLHLESWSMQLLSIIKAIETPCSCPLEKWLHHEGKKSLVERAKSIHSGVQPIVESYLDLEAGANFQGLTENLCRNILPVWVLREYDVIIPKMDLSHQDDQPKIIR